MPATTQTLPPDIPQNEMQARMAEALANQRELIHGMERPTVTSRILQTAKRYVGQRERPGNSGFIDRAFEQSMRRVGWWKGAAWCDFFAELVWSEAYAGEMKVQAILRKTFTGGTLRSFANFKRSGLFQISNHPTPGALVYWRHGLTTGHVGIVVATRTGDSTFLTVEGNTNSGGGREGYIVAERERSITDRRLLGFVYPVEP